MQGIVWFLLVSLFLVEGCLTGSNESENIDEFSVLAGEKWMVEKLDLSDSGVNQEAYLFTSKSSCEEKNVALKCGENGAPSCEEIMRQLEEKQVTNIEINGMFCYGQRIQGGGIFAECRVDEREVFPKATLNIITQEEFDLLKNTYPECPPEKQDICYVYDESSFNILNNGKQKISFRPNSKQSCGNEIVEDLKQKIMDHYKNQN